VSAVVDLNADLAEGFGRWSLGDDMALLELVTSANVACGFHAGDPAGIRAVCERAAERGVRVGAHPGYRDLAGFGRREMHVPRAELRDDLIYQLGAVRAMARAAGTDVSYVKVHGALNNRAVWDAEQAAAIVDAVTGFDADLPLVVMGAGQLLDAAQRADLEVVIEAYADRAYAADGTLVPRSRDGAVLTDPDRVVEQVLSIVTDGSVRAIEGTLVPLRARSVCLHGDTPGAVTLASRVRAALDATVAVRAFA
jgi:UPF0271 protein